MSANQSLRLGEPLITVATVVFNAANVLQAAIESVRAQSYPHIEYIVVDGGSTDGTLDLIRRHQQDITHWISEPDDGVYDAMNKALVAAHGDWLIFLGADDELKIPIESIVPHMTDRQAVYYGNVEIMASGEVSGGPFTRYRLMQSNICHQAIFYPRSVYQAKRYDTTVGALADHKYNIELWGSGVRFRHLDVVVSRFNDAGLSSANQHAFEAVKMQAIRASFGPFFYALKRSRNLAVKVLKRSHEPA
jgi:glycosyltransferase involved in cell wall biosynthesis